MGTSAYDPRSYWNELVTGDGRLSNVGQPALGVYNSYAYRSRLRGLKKALEGVDLGRMKVFEAAFGEGFYLAYWQSQRVPVVAGMDISEAATGAAKAKFPQYDLRCGDLSCKSDFADFGCFDVVTAIDVLYHIVTDEPRERALRNLLSMVEAEGVFVFSDKFPREGSYQRFSHVRRRSLSMWERVLSDAGFSILRLLPVFVLMDDPIECGEHPWLGFLSMQQWRVGTKLLRATQDFPRLQSVLGFSYATIQCLPERALLAMLKRTPNLELAVCSRSSSTTSHPRQQQRTPHPLR
ncbi:MAG: class I SAM-dependent methyltransferase [Planctomycetes bacterium]|nr:class I SAM-dependent methyltransferase [Planctomycetota bacterium]